VFLIFYNLNLQIMSIAEEEKQINEIINSSKQRLKQVEEKLDMLGNEKQSID